MKNYLRTTTGDERLSHQMVMAVEKELEKQFDLESLVNDFASQKHRRYPLSQPRPVTSLNVKINCNKPFGNRFYVRVFFAIIGICYNSYVCPCTLVVQL